MKAPLRIGYLIQQFPPEVGAGPARVTEMASHWLDAGAEVTVITGMPNRPEGRIHAEYRGKLFVEEEWKGARILRSWLYASPKHGFARTIANNLTFMASSFAHALSRAGKLDVLIASSPPFFPHLSGVLFSAIRRTPLVLEVRDLWPDYLVDMGVLKGKMLPGTLFALERRLLQAARHVVPVTDSFRRRIIDKGVHPDDITVIPNGMDASFYHATDEPAPIAEMKRQAGGFVVGYLGNIGAGQHLTTVVEAAARVAAVDPGIKFFVVGDGPDRQRVESRARELGLRNLSIHPPIVKNQTRAFYGACDLCLVPLAPVPIFQETVPSKIFETMACERPVLASLAGEAARIVNESGGGEVVAPGDTEALAAGILRMRAMPAAERATMGRMGRSYVLQHYDRGALARTYLDVMSRITDPNNVMERRTKRSRPASVGGSASG